MAQILFLVKNTVLPGREGLKIQINIYETKLLRSSGAKLQHFEFGLEGMFKQDQRDAFSHI